MEPSLERSPDRETGRVVAEPETPPPARGKAWLAAAGVSLAALLWLAAPRPPAGPAPLPPEPVSAPQLPTPPAPIAKPVPLSAPQADETAGLRPFDPRSLECGALAPNAALPGARLLGRGSPGRVTATIMPSDAGSNHSIYLGSLLLGASRGATGQESVDLGPFAYGQEFELSILVQDTGVRYRAGPAGRNPDRHLHAAVTALGVGVWQVGFEDLDGGGDGDFNDAIVVIRGELAAESPSGELKCSPPLP